MSPQPTTLPKGAKLWLLNLGILDVDAANVLAGANQFSVGLPPQPHERRDLIMIAGLIYHPDVGLVLFDTGSCENVIKSWGERALECGPRIWDRSIHGLPQAIKATGAGKITDVKAVVLSHLHCDHAGGLEHFLGTDVEIWCHEEEFKNAFWTYATGTERGTYLKDYLVVDRLNWKTFSGQTFEIFQGITLHHCPGHTVGSIAMELNLEQTGSVVLTGDAFHVEENYEQGIPPGTLTRDFNDWHRSRYYIRSLVQRKQAKVVLGHELSYFNALNISPKYTA
ncbi:N-acyl homoserine lactonase family protein [Aspergillus clavatus NRRL 1]|uniref:Metallo-beta-lactamase superfamily protein n=1 Tax=Aspergillus clavatus (strain ATCC 1007 / CBS 513.65 / DSM 816 / NCTC 3887 / NRRL 1 / QM 1276 / 107) TaxID=344612 RepID=A1C5L9_ASPCL|nr:metallo-beta-lactamase superfamily protein [Aspergillus clavatus NRRL 1]EAW14987.1 metallo-beta-lactamase superfamily protein [Aspergillus clavatus NRRL 1]